MSLLTASEWDEALRGFSQIHVLQSSAWGEVKSKFGWYSRRILVQNVGAQILFRKLPFGLSIAYLPKGPVGEGWQNLWPEVDALCRKEKAIFLKVEPDLWEGETDQADIRNLFPGFKSECKTIQPRRTIVVDLDGESETWLERMKKKHRYNIRLADKKDVQVQASNDVRTFHQLMQTTGERDAFGVHSLEYYQEVYRQFSPTGNCVLLLAYFEEIPLAGIMVLRSGNRAWYFYGASNNLERQRMPAYLLQYEGMKWAKNQGCNQYDLWGVPDEDEETLESQFEERAEGLWGVYRFKRGFGGTLRRSIFAFEKVYIPSLYWLYERYQNRREELNG